MKRFTLDEVQRYDGVLAKVREAAQSLRKLQQAHDESAYGNTFAKLANDLEEWLVTDGGEAGASPFFAKISAPENRDGYDFGGHEWCIFPAGQEYRAHDLMAMAKRHGWPGEIAPYETPGYYPSIQSAFAFLDALTAPGWRWGSNHANHWGVWKDEKNEESA